MTDDRDIHENPEGNDPLADAREIVDAIDDFLQQGKKTQAKSLFSKRWKDLVPELPLRFSVVLSKPSERAATRLAAQMSNRQDPPALALKPRSAKHGGYAIVVAADGTRIGDLPASDAKFLRSLGDDAALYQPRLLELRPPRKETLTPVVIAVELVRPELRLCSYCGKRHSDPHLNCAECRAKRRRTDPERALPEELPPLPLHEALDALLAEEFGNDSE